MNFTPEQLADLDLTEPEILEACAARLSKAVEPHLTNAGERRTWEAKAVPHPFMPCIDCALADRIVRVSKNQILETAKTDTWEILAEGTLQRLRNNHSFYEQRLYTYSEVHEEIEDWCYGLAKDVLGFAAAEDIRRQAGPSVIQLPLTSQPKARLEFWGRHLRRALSTPLEHPGPQEAPRGLGTRKRKPS